MRSDGAPTNLLSGASAVFYVNTNNNFVAYSNTTPITLSATVSNGWNKFAVECDYGSKVWNLELNDELAVSNFAFYGSPASFSAIEITDSRDDSDGDGLPDWWEDIYYGDLDANPGDLSSNGMDTVYSAYIAGLDPTDPDAAFLITDLRPLTSENVLWWNATSGRVYSIYWTSNLLNGFGAPWKTNLVNGIYTDTTHSAEEKGFYKIDVELE